MLNAAKSIAGKKGYEKSKEKLIFLSKQRSEKRLGLYNLSPKLCEQCNKPLSYKKRNKKLCSRTCTNNSHNWKNNVEKQCAYCNSTTYNDKFCSRRCRAEHIKKMRYEKKLELMLLGKLNDQRFLKAYLISKYGEKCTECSWAEINKTTGKIPIEMHHKDGNGNNNNLDNLVLLCPNHHSLTSSYRNNLKQSSRKNRKRSLKQLLKKKNKVYMSIDYAREEANKCQTRQELRNNKNTAYKYLCTHDKEWLDTKFVLLCSKKSIFGPIV